MRYGKQEFVFLCCILLLQLLPNAEAREFQAHWCNYDYTGTYTAGSRYQTNLDTIPSVFTSGSSSRFYNLTIGGGNPDTVNVIALCRGDVETDVCRSCLLDANDKLRQMCPNEKQSIGWYDECMLRYTDRNIFNTVTIFPNAFTYNPTTVPSAITMQFNQAVRNLSNQLTGVASGGSSVRKFATGSITAGPGSNITIYGLAECTPDLSLEQCSRCLSTTPLVLPECCDDGKIGARILWPSCNFRYEIGRFYRV